jgi:hypothetical protein
MKPLLAAAWFLLLPAAAFAQDEGTNLLANRWMPWQYQLSVYVPKVPAQVTCIRDDAAATRFALAAWEEDKRELHVDFTKEQVLVFAWGAMKCDESLGLLTKITCEKLTLTEDTVNVQVRTLIPPGSGMDVPLDANHAGRTYYPSLFLKTPRSERVVVDVVGSRRRDRKLDFTPVAEKELTVRLHPDTTPAREKIQMRRADDTIDTPQVEFAVRDDEHVLDLAWGKLGSGAYDLEMIGAELDGDVLRATVLADNVPIFTYSGPGVLWPRLVLQVPKVRTVKLHIVRRCSRTRRTSPRRNPKPSWSPSTTRA